MKVASAVYFVLVCLATIFPSGVTFALTPEAILAKTDSVKAPFESFVMDVEMKSGQGDMSLKVYSKRGGGILVFFLKPHAEKGRLLLMKGEDLWICMPGSILPIRISPTQRLMGSISNGDMARLRWSVDYTAKLIREDKKSYEMELISNYNNATYCRIEVIIEKHSFKPLRAKAFLQSGKLHKTIYYNGYTSFSGKLMPTHMKFVDHLRNEEESEMVFSHVRYQEIPDNYFNKDSLYILRETLLKNEK